MGLNGIVTVHTTSTFREDCKRQLRQASIRHMTRSPILRKSARMVKEAQTETSAPLP